MIKTPQDVVFTTNFIHFITVYDIKHIKVRLKMHGRPSIPRENYDKMNLYILDHAGMAHCRSAQKWVRFGVQTAGPPEY
jgi:hypothetical protein